MSKTPVLSLPYIATAQAQKEITHNEALNDLDFMAKTSAISHTLATPPASPSTGDTYIIAASPTGVWSGFSGHIAGYYGGWSIKAPVAGWTAWTRNGSRFLYYSGSAWGLLATPQLEATTTWNPGTIATGSGATSPAITVAGAAFGDLVMAAAPYTLQGVQVTGYVSAANTVVLRATNLTGANVALASGTWRVRVIKA